MATNVLVEIFYVYARKADINILIICEDYLPFYDCATDDGYHRSGGRPAKKTQNTMKWYINGKLHRDGDKPAIINNGGDKIWYNNGMIHRNYDKPAIISICGTQKWYKNGELHRNRDKPAIIKHDGKKIWYKNNKIHRDGDKPAVISAKDSKEWFIYGMRHREGGKPAFTSNQTDEWYILDICSRALQKY